MANDSINPSENRVAHPESQYRKPRKGLSTQEAAQGAFNEAARPAPWQILGHHNSIRVVLRIGIDERLQILR
jgi:hypothetical protein